MQVFFHKRFEKQFAKLTHRTQLRFKGKLKQFYINPLDSSLNNHALKGEFLGQRSINVTPDIRAVYQVVNEEGFLFTHIGSHSELYS